MSGVVLFVGPCRKYDHRAAVAHADFSEDTPTGRYVARLAKAVEGYGFRSILTNVLLRPHFSLGREAMPDPKDLVADWSGFEARIADATPRVIVAFGAAVRGAFGMRDGIRYEEGSEVARGDATVIFAAHPSYVLRYRRRDLEGTLADLSARIGAQLAPIKEPARGRS